MNYNKMNKSHGLYMMALLPSSQKVPKIKIAID